MQKERRKTIRRVPQLARLLSQLSLISIPLYVLPVSLEQFHHPTVLFILRFGLHLPLHNHNLSRQNQTFGLRISPLQVRKLNAHPFQFQHIFGPGGMSIHCKKQSLLFILAHLAPCERFTHVF